MDISLKISDLTDAQANTFVSRFLKNYFKAGFLALGKRDLELLLYYELEIAGVIDRDADNYSVATMLRVTPNRVASIRRDAYARWAKESDRKELLAMGLRRALSEDGIQGALDSISNAKLAGGFIPLLLEHPTQRGELEQALKQLHVAPDYTRNKEIMLVKVDVLLEALGQLSMFKIDTRAQKVIRAELAKDKTLKDLLASDVARLTGADFRAAMNNALASAVESGVTSLVPTLLSKMVVPFITGAPA